LSRRTRFEESVRQLLADAEALAEGPGMDWDPKVKRGKTESRRPHGGKATLDGVLDRLERAHDEGRREVDAEKRRQYSLEMKASELSWRIGQPDNRGVRACDVAEKLGLDEPTVRKHRAAKGLNTDTGVALEKCGGGAARNPNSLANLRRGGRKAA